jgi:hypothetical protein
MTRCPDQRKLLNWTNEVRILAAVLIPRHTSEAIVPIFRRVPTLVLVIHLDSYVQEDQSDR